MCALNTVYTPAAVYYVARSAADRRSAWHGIKINVLCRFVGGSRTDGHVDGRVWWLGICTWEGSSRAGEGNLLWRPSHSGCIFLCVCVKNSHTRTHKKIGLDWAVSVFFLFFNAECKYHAQPFIFGIRVIFPPKLCKQTHQALTVVAQTDVTSVSHERLTSSLSVALSPKPDANDKNIDF